MAGSIDSWQIDSQMYDGRNWKCGPKRTEDGEKGLMNYGKRRSVWSRCTRRDFENYLNRILQTKPDFCLKEFTGMIISKDNKILKKYLRKPFYAFVFPGQCYSDIACSGDTVCKDNICVDSEHLSVTNGKVMNTCSQFKWSSSFC